MKRFGSLGPDIYKYVMIGVPYTASEINEEDNITMTIDYFYDEDWNIIWDRSTDLLVDLSDDFASYTEAPYIDYINGNGGVVCDPDDVNLTGGLCYKDIDNDLLWFKIPHFSGIGPSVSGTSSGGSSSSSHSGGGGSDSATTEVTETDTTVKMREGQYKSFTYGGSSHKVTIKDIDRGEKKITIEVKSTPQTFELSEGENVLVDLDGDNDKDLSVTFVSISGVDVYLTIEGYDDEPEGQVSEPVVIDTTEEPGEVEVEEEGPVTKEETFLDPSEEDVEFQEKLVHGEEPLNPMTAIIAGIILLMLVTIYEVSTYMYLKHKKRK